MVTTGEAAPEITAPLANGDYGSFTLSEAIDDGPVVLAFFPGAFSQICTAEMAEFQDRLEEFEKASAQIYGVSVDTPSALNAFRDELGLEFDLISDNEKDVIQQYGLSMDFDAIGVTNVAKRSVVVVGEDGEVAYTWTSDDPSAHPDYDEVRSAAASA